MYSSLVTLLLSLAVLLICLLYKQPNGDGIVKNLVIAIVLVSLLNLSSSIIWYRRYDYYTIAQASRYIANKSEKVAYYDDSGVSTWFLRENGIYFSGDMSESEQLSWLKRNNIKYAIYTNEYNEDGELTVLKSESYADKFILFKAYSYQKKQWPSFLFDKIRFIGEEYLPVSELYVSEIYKIKQ
jgi:hypothetical protein